MGIKTHITLQEVQTLFPSFSITSISPTKDGVIDTTYIVTTRHHKEYILKHYERDITTQVLQDASRLSFFASSGLRVPVLEAQKQGWYLYTKLSGEVPRSINTQHIVSLARFMATLHTHSVNMQEEKLFIDNYPLPKILHYTKHNFFAYYKKLQSLQNYTQSNDGFIHGDIFKDNCVFDGNIIGVFDFIDGGGGSFAFDCGVALMAFSPPTRNYYNTQLFVRIYNQKAPKKLSYKELDNAMQEARQLYALLRINHHKSTKKAKALVL